MIAGNPKARAVQFFLDSNVVPLNLMGDGLLPPDIDGTRRPMDPLPRRSSARRMTTMFYGDLRRAQHLRAEGEVEGHAGGFANPGGADAGGLVRLVFPCGPSRGCIPQPGITNPDQYLDILSYRQRPTWRLAYRNIGTYEALVTNQSVEAPRAWRACVGMRSGG